MKFLGSTSVLFGCDSFLFNFKNALSKSPWPTYIFHDLFLLNLGTNMFPHWSPVQSILEAFQIQRLYVTITKDHVLLVENIFLNGNVSTFNTLMQYISEASEENSYQAVPSNFRAIFTAITLHFHTIISRALREFFFIYSLRESSTFQILCIESQQ